MKKGREELVWTAVEGSDPMLPFQERGRIELHGINLHGLPKDTCWAWMFLHLTFPDYNCELNKMNATITTENYEAAMWVNPFTLTEFLMGLGFRSAMVLLILERRGRGCGSKGTRKRTAMTHMGGKQ